MFQFENRLSKLKHDILTRIAVLAKQSNVTKDELEKIPYEIIQGDIPKYRDSVQHERDVVLERAKLAAGYLPNGKYNDELIDISEENNIKDNQENKSEVNNDSKEVQNTDYSNKDIDLLLERALEDQDNE